MEVEGKGQSFGTALFWSKEWGLGIWRGKE